MYVYEKPRAVMIMICSKDNNTQWWGGRKWNHRCKDPQEILVNHNVLIYILHLYGELNYLKTPPYRTCQE